MRPGPKMTTLTNMTISSRKSAAGGVWTVADAKARLSEVITRATVEGPQHITRNGTAAAVVVSAEEWSRKTTRAGNLADFFAASPLRGSGLKLRRRKDRARQLDL